MQVFAHHVHAAMPLPTQTFLLLEGESVPAMTTEYQNPLILGVGTLVIYDRCCLLVQLPSTSPRMDSLAQMAPLVSQYSHISIF